MTELLDRLGKLRPKGPLSHIMSNILFVGTACRVPLHHQGKGVIRKKWLCGLLEKARGSLMDFPRMLWANSRISSQEQ